MEQESIKGEENNIKYTPEKITKLKTNEYIFVGTNTEGKSGAGLALECVKKFGLKYGVSRGLSGQCYAIVTKDLNAPNYGLRSIPLEYIEKQILKAYEFIKTQPDDTVWYMTKIGCNLAGYTEPELNKILQDIKEYQPKNVILPLFK